MLCSGNSGSYSQVLRCNFMLISRLTGICTDLVIDSADTVDASRAMTVVWFAAGVSLSCWWCCRVTCLMSYRVYTSAAVDVIRHVQHHRWSSWQPASASAAGVTGRWLNNDRQRHPIISVHRSCLCLVIATSPPTATVSPKNQPGSSLGCQHSASDSI